MADSDGQRVDAGEGEEARGRGLQGRVGVAGPGEEVRGGAIEGDRPLLHRHYPVRCGQATLQTVFGQQDRDPPLLVQSAQKPDQLIAGDRVELGGGLVEEDQTGASNKGGGECHALQLASGERVNGAVQQVRDRQGEGDLLDGSGAVRGLIPAHLQR